MIKLYHTVALRHFRRRICGHWPLRYIVIVVVVKTVLECVGRRRSLSDRPPVCFFAVHSLPLFTTFCCLLYTFLPIVLIFNSRKISPNYFFLWVHLNLVFGLFNQCNLNNI